MNHSANCLEHIGLVTDSSNSRLIISLVGSGCSACHKSLCMLGDSKAKEVEIPVQENSFRAGDEVIIRINPESGYQAVFLLYFMPFLLMLLALIIMLRAGYNEGISGLTSLLVLAPYFGLLYTFRKRLGTRCKMEVVKR
ncbi:MAG: SoxR reducing system RseC family protein [Cyclobacteriaceae bacterium]